MNFFQGHVSPVAYLSEFSENTRNIGDKKRALTWIAAVSIATVILSMVIGSLFGSTLYATGAGIAFAVVWALMMISISGLFTMLLRALGGDISWGNYFCTATYSSVLLILPATASTVLTILVGPDSIISVLGYIAYGLYAIAISISMIMASSGLSVGRSVLSLFLFGLLTSLVAGIITFVSWLSLEHYVM